MDRIRESQVSEAIAVWLHESGWASISQYPLLGKVADICARSSDHERLIAVECKESDWGRALRQAVVYQAATDEAYVALPRRAVSARLLLTASASGVGVLAVDSSGAVEVALSPVSRTGWVEILRNRARDRFDESYDLDEHAN